jgi:uroporphyrinogen decarboxylase
MVRTPELAAEVTLQPLKRFPGLDAAILFSDILVIPEAIGVGYRFRDEGGIELERTIRSGSDVAALDAEGVVERLYYVGEALKLLKEELGGEKALLGFCGAPWTLALYLVEGGSPGEGRHLRELLYRQPLVARELLEKVTRACEEYVRLQCASGADASQLFDSWASLCPSEYYDDWCIEPSRRIRLACEKPMILFSRGAGHRLAEQISVGAEAIAVDWSTPLKYARENLGSTIALQGNLDPLVLETEPKLVRETVKAILGDRRGDAGFILNGGHGLSPKTRIDCVEALLDAVEGWRFGR